MALNKIKASTAVAAFVAASAVSAALISSAAAVPFKVKVACKNDYYTHCSQHEPGSVGVRKCMRAVGKRLSQGCRDALVEAGLATRSKKYAQK